MFFFVRERIFEKLKQFLTLRTKHPWLFFGSLLTVVVVVSLVAVAPTYAGVGEDVADWILRTVIIQPMLALARLAIGLTIFAMRFFIEISAYNGYITTPTVVIGWLLVRDVANMFFVVVLLVIAFGTILGIEQYEWKKTMGHFIFAAIAINFSKTICGLIIDVAHVFTMTFLNAVSAAAGGNLISLFNLDDMLSFIRAPGSIQDFSVDIFIAAVTALIFSVLALWTVGAYMIIMLARVLVLWVLIILSPLAYLLGAVPTLKGKASEWWSKFLNQVMVAPVMVFFFWLAFATLGSGDIAAGQLGLNGLTGSPQINDATAVIGAETPSVSILKAGTWENMANFFIGAGMLWVGLMVVGQMGVVGGGLTQGVMNFAKKVATIATGYAAGRWLVGKGKDASIFGLKEAGKRIPFVGGAALKEYGTAIASVYKRKGLVGLATGGKASGLGGYESQIKRSEQAKKWEEQGGVLNWLRARAWEPAERAGKRSEDWKKAAELAEKRRDESYTTSSSRAGQSKLQETTKWVEVEKKAKEKSASKLASRQNEAMKINELFEIRVRNDATTRGVSLTDKDAMNNLRSELKGNGSVMDEIRETYLAGIVDDKDREKAARLMARDGGVRGRLDLGQFIESERKVTTKSRAEQEEVNKYAVRAEEIRVAEEKDKMLRDQNMTPRYLESVLAKHQKEDIELAGSSNFDRAMAKVNHVRDRLTALKRAVPPADPAALARHQEEIRRYEKELSNLQLFNVSRGATFGMSGINRVADSVRTDGVMSDNVLTMQAKALSSVIGERVSANEASIDATMDRLRQDMGDEKYTSFMKSFIDGLAVSAEDGAVNLAGLFREEYDASTGRSTFRRTDNTRDAQYIAGKQGYAADQSHFGKITGFDGAVDSVRDAAGGEHVVVTTQKAIDNMIKIFGKVTQNVANQVHGGSIDNWNNIFESVRDGHMTTTELSNLLNQLEQKGDADGLRAMLRRTNARAILGTYTHRLLS